MASAHHTTYDETEPNLGCIAVGFYLFAGGFTLLVVLAFAIPILANIYI